MDGGSDLKSELQLSTNMICWKPASKCVADHSIPRRKKLSALQLMASYCSLCKELAHFRSVVSNKSEKNKELFMFFYSSCLF